MNPAQSNLKIRRKMFQRTNRSQPKIEEQSPLSKKTDKQLKLQSNLYEFMIKQPSNINQSLNQTNFFNLQFTPISSVFPRSITKERTQSVTKNMLLQYSPQSDEICKINEEKEDSLLLNDDSLEGEYLHHSKISCSNQTKQSRSSESVKELTIIPQLKCSDFKLTFSKMEVSALTSHTFRINYFPFHPYSFNNILSNNHSSFLNQKLVQKIKKNIVKQPFLIFDFVDLISQENNETNLKLFLLSNSIKYSYSQLLSLKQKIEELQKIMKPCDIVQMLFSLNQQDEFVINLDNLSFQFQIDYFQRNFWKAFSNFKSIKDKIDHQNYQIVKLKQFINRIM